MKTSGKDSKESKEEAGQIKLGQLRGQLPATRVKYKDTIEACGSMEHIGLHVNSGWKARIWAGSRVRTTPR